MIHSRPVALVAALLLCVATLSAQYKAVPPTKIPGTNITWTITADGVLRISGTGAIPDFSYKTENKHWRKYYPAGFHRIEIGEGITQVGNYAFGYIDGDLPSSMNKINLSFSLPNSLISIGGWAFYFWKNPEFDLILPPNLETVGDLAFYAGKYQSITLPPSLKRIGRGAFGYSNIETLVISGNPIIDWFAFRDNKHLKDVTITGSPKLEKNDIFEGCKSLTTFNVPVGFSQKDKLLAYNPGAKIVEIGSNPNTTYIANNTRRQTNKGTAGEYIVSKVGTYEDYVRNQTKDLKMPDPAEMKRAIESDIAQWQVKGEFESTAKWQARVNEQTRRARVDSLTRVSNARAAAVKAEMDRRLPCIKANYEQLRRQYADEFYAQRKTYKLKQYKASQLELKPYDADNEAFLITSATLGDVLLSVPVDQAPAFKQNWATIRQGVAYEFAPKDETDVALTKMTFTNAGRKYVYDGSVSVNYHIADVNYNFAPLEITDLSSADIVLTPLAEQSVAPAGNTVGIEGRKVDVAHNTVTVGDGVPDVDASVPAGSAKRATTFAVVISNENYRRTAAVPYAANDGKMVKQYLNKTLGLPAENVHHITDASLNDMRYELQWLRRVCDAHHGEASVIVYYAGHGVPDASTLDAYLLPVDGYAEDAANTGYSLAELQRSLGELPSTGATLMLDACFSGAGREGGMLAQASRGVALKARTYNPLGQLVVLSASQGTETAHPYAEKRHGLFTYFLLKKLGETKGAVTLGELSDYITDQVKKVSSIKGTPQTPSVLTAPGNTTWATRGL